MSIFVEKVVWINCRDWMVSHFYKSLEFFSFCLCFLFCHDVFRCGIEVAQRVVRAGKGQGCDGPASGMPNLSLEDVLDRRQNFYGNQDKEDKVGWVHQ